jgi:hypothetical protein
VTDKRVSIEELRDIVESEDLGYAIEYYIEADKVPIELEESWKKAGEIMAHIRSVLFPR